MVFKKFNAFKIQFYVLQMLFRQERYEAPQAGRRFILWVAFYSHNKSLACKIIKVLFIILNNHNVGKSSTSLIPPKVDLPALKRYYIPERNGSFCF